MPFSAKIGLILVGLFVSVAILAPLLEPYSPGEQSLERRFEGPSPSHLLGLDGLGRDVLSRLLRGSQVSLLVAVSATLLAVAVGVIVGSLAGFLGGRVDLLISGVVDIFLAFPGILLAIALVAVLPPGKMNVIVALAVMGWTGYARLVRGQVIKLRELEFVLASEASGAGGARIVTRHILPNVLSPVLVQASLGMGGVILAEASLSFLGLGVAEGVPSWGSMLADGWQAAMLGISHPSLAPGFAIFCTILGFNFLGDGLRDWLDPKTLRL